MFSKSTFHFLSGLLTAAFFIACSGDSGRKDPDVSDVRVDLQLQRFDRDLFALDSANLEAGLDALAERYPDFLPFFVQEIAHDPTQPDETPLEALQGFLGAEPVRRLQDSVQLAYADLDWLQKDLARMFQYYRHYFPDQQAPRVVTAVTEFVSDAYMVNDSLMMIGLDFFLGKDFPGYHPELFPQYLRRQFSREYMTTKAALALSNRIAGPPPGERVLDYMINNGKILYLMDHLLPAVPDSIKMGYTREQMEGCYANEQNVWARLLDMKVLYEPLGTKNQKIVMPSPAADNVFTEAPGEIGNWIGWQIVKAYMERYPETTMEALFRLQDSQALLEAARYKPKRN